MSGKLRIGVRGFDHSSQSEFVEDVTHGVFVMWVEFPSGARVKGDELTSVTIYAEADYESPIASTGIQFSAKTAHPIEGVLDTFVAPEIVYVDKEGDPLPYKEGAK